MNSFFMLGAKERVEDKNQLLRLAQLVDWEALRPHLKGMFVSEVSPDGGRKPYDILKMFKAILLGQWHNLSDPKLEESLRVRLDFMLFTEFDVNEPLPDETTLCRFRNRLIAKGLDKKLFQLINQQLEQLGLEIEKAEGAIVDATVIESAARPRRTIEMAQDREEEQQTDTAIATMISLEESADPDRRWLKKGKRCYFGYKGFVRTTVGCGFIQKVNVLPANQAEVNQLETMMEDFQG